MFIKKTRCFDFFITVRLSLACVSSNRLHLTLSSCKCLIIWDRPFKDIGYWKFNSIRILATIHFDGAISSPISRLLLIGYYRIRHFLHVPPLRQTNNHFLKTAAVFSTDSKNSNLFLIASIWAKVKCICLANGNGCIKQHQKTHNFIVT